MGDDESTVKPEVSTRNEKFECHTTLQLEAFCAFEGGEAGSFVQCRVCERAPKGCTQRVCRDDGVQSRQGCSRGEEATDSSDTSSNVLVSEVRSSHFVVGVSIERDGKYIVQTWIKDE